MLKIHAPDPPLDDGVVRLRPWRHADADELVAGWTDPDVRRWNEVPEDVSVDAARHWIAGWSERARTGVSIDLVVVDANTADVVGEVGVAHFDERQSAAELGFWLLSSARGKGYAAAAVALVAGWITDEVGVRLLFTRAHPDNEGSARVLARAGFENRGRSAEGLDVYKYDPKGISTAD